jgi:hypothetical protein
MKQILLSIGTAAALLLLFWQLLLPQQEAVRLISSDSSFEVQGFALEGQNWSLAEQPQTELIAAYELNPDGEVLPFGGFRIEDSLNRDLYTFDADLNEWHAQDAALQNRLAMSGRFGLLEPVEIDAPSFESDVDEMLSEIDAPLTRVDVHVDVLIPLDGVETLVLNVERNQFGCGSRTRRPELISRERNAVLPVNGLMQEVGVRINLELHGPQEGCELLEI